MESIENLSRKSPQTDLEKWFWNRLGDVFWKHVDRTGDCWVWTGHKNKWGYGQITVMKKSFGSHRVSWEMQHGAIPEGLEILHSCDNPACVRPDHLFAGTQSENISDSVAKGRQIGNRKLTIEQVKEIRLLRLTATSTEIASKYGVGRNTIEQIWSGETWKNIG